jgi:acetyltransferase
MTGLAPLFSPRGVAVLGASRNPAKLGHRLLQNLRESGYPGLLVPVNPSGEPVLGVETVTSVDAIPEGLDLALVSLPASAVPGAIKTLAARRTRAAVVMTSGFGEVDEDGRAAQTALVGLARAAGLRLVGPNCMGIYSRPARLNGTYFWDLPRLDGGISVVSQSGAYGGLIFRQLGIRGLGIARFVSIGNQADVDLAEVLDYLADDAETTLVACFIEAVRDGRRLVEVAARTTARKPVVALKGGRSDAGRRAAGSHTGSLAGTYEVYRAALRQAGVVVAEETEEFLDAIEALAIAGHRPAAPAVAVITVSGGPSVVAADTAERLGLQVPPLGDDTRAGLRRLLPSFAAVGNPVDLTPQVEPSRIGPAVRLVLDQPAVAGAIAVNVGLDIPEFADAIVDAAVATGKPAVAFAADAPGIASRLRAGGVPVLASPERAVRGWRALWEARPPGPRMVPDAGGPEIPDPVRRALDTGRGVLPHALARPLLEAFGVRFCRETGARTPEEAAAAADALGYPVVVKADVAGLVHRTEAGAVRTGLLDRPAVLRASADLRDRLGAPALLVQEQVGPGAEFLIGGRRDPGFGPVVAVGAGGVLAELMRDVVFRLAPLGPDEALAMLGEGARARLLGGFRGLPACEGEPLVRTILGVAGLLSAEPAVLEVDLNPVIAAGASAVAVDAVVIVEGTGGGTA